MDDGRGTAYRRILTVRTLIYSSMDGDRRLVHSSLSMSVSSLWVSRVLDSICHDSGGRIATVRRGESASIPSGSRSASRHGILLRRRLLGILSGGGSRSWRIRSPPRSILDSSLSVLPAYVRTCLSGDVCRSWLDGWYFHCRSCEGIVTRCVRAWARATIITPELCVIYSSGQSTKTLLRSIRR